MNEVGLPIQFKIMILRFLKKIKIILFYKKLNRILIRLLVNMLSQTSLPMLSSPLFNLKPNID